MSGALSDGFARLVRLDRHDRHLVLIAAISGGFASVFGVPMEVLAPIGFVAAYLFSAHRGIYGAQRIGTPKHPFITGPPGDTLRDTNAARVRPRRRPRT